jgi:hypothetical protein
VEAAAKRYNLDHPILMDNDYAYWNALGNRYWPSFYVVGKDGVIAARVVGEVHEGESQANRVDDLIAELLEKS